MSFDGILRALKAQKVAREWVVASRTRRTGVVEHGARELRRVDEHARIDGVVHRDLATGRGSGRFVLEGDDRIDALDRALAQAAAAVGPAWRLAPPAAAARVDLDDASIDADLDAAAETITTLAFGAARQARLVALAGGAVTIVDAVATVSRDELRVATSHGQDARWTATELELELRVQVRGRATSVRIRARRRGGLELAAALAEAVERLGAADAGPPPPGRYPVVLRLAALAPLEGFGLWAGFAAQADAARVRRGLARYQPGQPIADGAVARGEPLTISSDGTLPYGLASAPLDDDGAPVRRFTLVERGRAAELAFDPREAALAGARPNGGVRNLIVEPGASPAAALITSDDGPVVDVASLAWLDVADSGAFSAGVEFGWLRTGDQATPITGAVIRGDAIAVLAAARRAAEVSTRGVYRGPVAIRTPPLAVS
jgi:PmbA protein